MESVRGCSLSGGIPRNVFEGLSFFDWYSKKNTLREFPSVKEKKKKISLNHSLAIYTIEDSVVIYTPLFKLRYINSDFFNRAP